MTTNEIQDRFNSHSLDTDQVCAVQMVRAMGKSMTHIIDLYCVNNREKAIAVEKIEEAVMWANKSIAIDSSGSINL